MLSFRQIQLFAGIVKEKGIIISEMLRKSKVTAAVGCRRGEEFKIIGRGVSGG